MTIRIFLLRVLIGWWLIPCYALISLPRIYFLTDNREAEFNDFKEVSRIIWYGFL